MKPTLPAIIPLLLFAGCNGEVYVRDGVTDGDTFYLAEHVLTDDNPVLQSWVSYSLTLSTCKLVIGGDNPARASSFRCELLARQQLVDTWQEKRHGQHDAYLDALARVNETGWLREYVASHFARPHWLLPDGLDYDGYRHFARTEMRDHRPVTRLTGSWNYARNVRATR